MTSRICQLTDPRNNPDRGRTPAISWGIKRRKEIITFGTIPQTGEGFVYVGETPGGRVKVGMSSNPTQRGATLGIEIRFVMPVCPQAAKELETEALQILGHKQHDGEWLKKPDVNAAVAAVREGMERLRKRLWVDPHLTEEEARRVRVRLALDEATARMLAETPDRNRRVSITSFRRAAGTKAAYGGRF